MIKLGKRAWTLIIVGLILVGGGIAFGASRSRTTYETEAISSGPVVEEISVTGSIAPKTKIDLQAEASAKVTDVKVVAGDEVKEGDLLIQLNASDLSARIAGAQAAVNAAAALLNQYQAGATAEELQISAAAVDSAQARYGAAVTAEADAKTSLDNAKASRDNAKAKVAVNLQTKTDSLVQAYDTALTAAQDAVDRLTSQMFSGNDLLTFVATDAQAETNAMNTRLSARSALASMSSLIMQIKVGDGSKAADAYAEIDADLRAIKAHLDACAEVLRYASGLASTTVSSYQSNASLGQTSLNTNIQTVTSAKNSYDLQKSLNDADLTAADSAVSTAEAVLNTATHAVDTAQKSLAQSQADYAYRLAGVRPEQIAAQQAQVQAARANLSSLYADLAKRRVEAPIDGIVTDVNVEKGEAANLGQVLVSMNTRGKFEIVANISEVDIAKIKVSDTVNITLDAFPSSQVWTGKVISIWPAEKVVQGVIFYETRIVFDQEDDQLKSGMTANLDIEVGRADNVLRVPIRAVHEEPGRKYVQVLVDEKPVERDITTGLENTEWLEVAGGLSAGDQVVVGSGNK